ncbi:TPA: hypothetical protein DCW54_01275 [Candidatus Dependentiae bacterium]|nr:hypothetical protein [Candidatus Dependentiae bacterium]
MKSGSRIQRIIFSIFFPLFLYPIAPENNAPQITSLFSSHDALQAELLTLIAQETQKIQIAVFRLSDKLIANALLEKKKQGIKIEIVTDAGSLDSRINQILNLHQHGIPIYIYPPGDNTGLRGLMHHKFCLFFANTAQHKRIIWTGSYNFTKAAATSNQENALILLDNKTWKKFAQEFRTLKKSSQRL